MRVDPWGLGYTVHGQSLSVHYPTRDATGALVYGAGLPFDHEPELLRTPTSERSVLWQEMLHAAR